MLVMNSVSKLAKNTEERKIMNGKKKGDMSRWFGCCFQARGSYNSRASCLEFQAGLVLAILVTVLLSLESP